MGWALWKIEESQESLFQSLNELSLNHELQEIHHPEKKLEWLSSRLVIKKLVEHFGYQFHGIYKDAFGKPHLNQLSYHISIAHCFPFAVGALHKEYPVGIDIEQPRDKLLRIRDRFLSDQEVKVVGTDIGLLCKFWTGKEVLYKIYGRKKLVFREHIHIDIDSEDDGKLIGQILFHQFHQRYTIKTDYIDGHYISIGS